MNPRILAAGLVLAIAGAIGPAKAQEAAPPQPGDPQRWYRADLTPQDRYRTSMKEMTNALKDALDECRAQGQGPRGACEREAREQYRTDVALVKARLAQETATRG